MNKQNAPPSLEDLVSEFHPHTKNNLLWHFPTKDSIEPAPILSKGNILFGTGRKKLYYCDALSGKKIWSYNKGEIWHPPIFYSDRIFFPSDKTYSDGEIRCLDEQSGKTLWSFQDGKRRYGPPAISDSKLFFGSRGFLISDNKNHRFYCLNALSGEKLWDFEIRGEIGYYSPTISKNKVFFHNKDGNLHCLNKETGEEQWRFSIKPMKYSPGTMVSTPIVSNGKLFFGANDGNFYCLDEQSGLPKWHRHTGREVWNPPVISNGKVYFSCRDGCVYCLDTKTGNGWRFPTGDWIKSSPIISNGKVYFSNACSKKNTYCLEEGSPNLVWEQEGKHCGNHTSVCGDRVYSGGGISESLHCLDARTGEELWDYKTDNGVWTTPLTSLGCVFFGDHKGLYCLGSRDKDVSRARRFVARDQTLPPELGSTEPEKRLKILKKLEALLREGKKRDAVDESFLRYAKKCGVHAD